MLPSINYEEIGLHCSKRLIRNFFGEALEMTKIWLIERLLFQYSIYSLKPAIMDGFYFYFYFFFNHRSCCRARHAFLPSGPAHCYSTQLTFISSTQNQIYSQLYKLPRCSWQVAANFFNEEIPCQEQPREKVSV